MRAPWNRRRPPAVADDVEALAAKTSKLDGLVKGLRRETEAQAKEAIHVRESNNFGAALIRSIERTPRWH